MKHKMGELLHKDWREWVRDSIREDVNLLPERIMNWLIEDIEHVLFASRCAVCGESLPYSMCHDGDICFMDTVPCTCGGKKPKRKFESDEEKVKYRESAYSWRSSLEETTGRPIVHDYENDIFMCGICRAVYTEEAKGPLCDCKFDSAYA